MLNIKVYSGVPFQRDYNNVIKFESLSNLTTYLETYIEGTISNIAQFFDGKNEIVLSDLFENCNYMYINDTNSATPNKFYFIENYEFISGGGVKYHLILDIWTTYNSLISFKPSLCVRGHCDILNIPEYKVNNSNLKSNKILDNTDTNCITNMLINKYGGLYSEGSLVVIVNVSQTGGGYQGIDILYKTIFLSGFLDAEYLKQELKNAINNLNVNHFTSIDTQLDYDFQVIKCYFLPSINFEDKLKGLYHTTTLYSYAKFGAKVMVNTSEFVRMNFQASLYNSSDTLLETINFNSFNSIDLASDYIYKRNLSRKNFEGKRVIIGTLDNYREIDVTGLTNENDTMTLKMYLLEMKQIEIMLECNNIKINLTSSFEIPFMNDEYMLYLNQNQNQINVANKQNALNLGLSLAGITAGLLLSPATSGGSLALAIGTINTTSAISKAISVEEMRNAQLHDMQNKFDKLDATNNNCIMSIINGVGAFTIEDYDNFSIDLYERFGNETQYYISGIYPSNTSLYNYVYIKFSNVVLNGKFNEYIRSVFESMFNSGIRIWFNASQYLISMTHERS